LKVLFCKFCCWPRRSCCRRSEAWVAWSAQGFPLLGPPVCSPCICVAAIDTPAAIIVVAESCWDTHDALVAFVSKIASWLWGWLPRPSSLRSRGSFCEWFGASRWWHQLYPLRSVIALAGWCADHQSWMWLPLRLHTLRLGTARAYFNGQSLELWDSIVKPAI
jgi:hypothetical protein